MTFREDESRIRKGQGALAFFKQDETKVASMKAKKKMAGLDDYYRSTLLEAVVKMH
jgi:hypothetical protein